jgi:hypothetical protein
MVCGGAGLRDKQELRHARWWSHDGVMARLTWSKVRTSPRGVQVLPVRDALLVYPDWGRGTRGSIVLLRLLLPRGERGARTLEKGAARELVNRANFNGVPRARRAPHRTVLGPASPNGMFAVRCACWLGPRPRRREFRFRA